MIERCCARGRSPLRRVGVTLLEVIAAAVILGTSVTTMLLAQGHTIEQLSESHRQLTASAVANELIAHWRLTREDVAATSSGTVDGLAGWRWSRRSESMTVAEGHAVTRVILTVTRVGDGDERNHWTRVYRWIDSENVRTDTTP